MPARQRPRNEPDLEQPDLHAVAVVPEHTHPAPQSTRTSRALAGLAVLFLVFIAYLGWMQYRSDKRQDAIEAYIAQAKSLRDEQNRDVNERINEAVCAILGRLPAGPLLDPIREDYDCGPGLMPAQMSPAQIAEVERDYGPAALARTPGQFYELFPADPLGTGIEPRRYGDVPPPTD